MAGNERVFRIRFGSVYPLYVEKVEKKGRSKEELDEVLRWLTGSDQDRLETIVADDETDLRTFFDDAPELNPDRELITGVICGVRVEEIEDPLMREIRYMDKVVDELARGKAMEKILRTPA